MEDMKWTEHLCKVEVDSQDFHEDDVGERRANFVERGSQMNNELARDLTGDLVVTTEWNALTHVTTSRRANAIFVSRDAHANTGYSDVMYTHAFVANANKMSLAHEQQQRE